ncbi:MAG: hypothetical protein VZS44_09240, partial [Bacilli bacterium]|nr:hypothetical protein [Bacilli bacterium]
MIFSKQTTEKLKQLNILEKTQAMSRQEFIDTYKDSDNITLRTMAQKYSNYNEDGTIGEVKRDLVVNIYEPNGEITNNKRKYNKQVYNVFVIIRQLINKYGRDGSDFYLPIEYISRCANSSERTVKKSINTLLKYKVVNFVGYTRDNSIFAMCIFSLHNIDVLNEWIDYGKVLHDTEYKEETINTILKTNTKINSEPKYELHRQQQVKKSLKAMKECPMLIKKFNESNYDYTDFRQSFLLDGKLRAYSNFTLTKNPEHHIENTMRGTMLQELSTINHNSYDYRYDLPASIYTLSHYLKTNELLINKDDKYFYSIFAKKLKEKYNNPNKVIKTDKDLVKTLCMTTYMHGYSFVNKAQFLSGSTKEMTKEEREEYINR